MTLTPLVLMVAGSFVAGLGVLLLLFAVTGLGILLVTPGVALAWLGLLQRQANERLVGAGARRVVMGFRSHCGRADPHGTARRATTYLTRDRQLPETRPAHVPPAPSPMKEERCPPPEQTD